MPKHTQFVNEDTFANSYILDTYNVKDCVACKLLKKKYFKTFKICSDCAFAQKQK